MTRWLGEQELAAAAHRPGPEPEAPEMSLDEFRLRSSAAHQAALALDALEEIRVAVVLNQIASARLNALGLKLVPVAAIAWALSGNAHAMWIPLVGPVLALANWATSVPVKRTRARILREARRQGLDLEALRP